jgi:hypothetical protein
MTRPFSPWDTPSGAEAADAVAGKAAPDREAVRKEIARLRGHRDVIAAAIANARGMRRGMPAIKNILEILPTKLREEVLDDADNVIRELAAQLERSK